MAERKNREESGSGALDQETLAALYAEHGADLLRFLRGLLKDPEGARNALQATFAKAAAHGHQACPESIRGWLFRVAYHEAMTVRRRQSVERRAARGLNARTLDEGAGPDGLAERSEDVERVRQALESLPPEQRIVVRARIYEDRTFAEIARQQGVPLGTVLTRMRLALGRSPGL